jgi:hypothetical protein
MQKMQINTPFYKHDIPSGMNYQEAVKAAKEFAKQTQLAAKEAKRQEYEAKKVHREATQFFTEKCLEEACLAPEEILERIASSAYTINPKTGEPYNSFLVRVNFQEDFLEEVEGREFFKSEILASAAFQIAVKKYYRKYECSGVRFTFPKGKTILVMTIFLEPNEKKVIKEKKVEKKETSKPSNVYSMLEQDIEKDVDTTIVVEEKQKPMNLKGAWAKK